MEHSQDLKHKIANSIKTMRLLKGYSQEYLAMKVNKSQNWIQKVENGETELTVNHLEIISNALEIDPIMLVSFDSRQIFHQCSHFGGTNYYNNDNKDVRELIDSIHKLHK